LQLSCHNQTALIRSHLINGMFSSHCIIVDLTDDQWAVIQSLIPDPTRRPDGKGRPWKDARDDIMNGVLWILRTGAPWYDMPR
jgi:hypothetical protein